MRWSTAQPWISLTHIKKKKRCIACHWTALTLMTLATVTVYIPTIIYFLIQAALRRPFIIVLLAIYHLKYKKHKANKEMLPVCCKIRDCFLRHGLDICSCLRCKKNPTRTIIKNFFFSVSASSISSSNTAFTENFTPTRPTQLFPCRLRLNLHS